MFLPLCVCLVVHMCHYILLYYFLQVLFLVVFERVCKTVKLHCWLVSSFWMVTNGHATYRGQRRPQKTNDCNDTTNLFVQANLPPTKKWLLSFHRTHSIVGVLYHCVPPHTTQKVNVFSILKKRVCVIAFCCYVDGTFIALMRSLR
jgi:hypothetical protein